MKFNIAMATGGLAFNGNSLKTKGLGGSETAFICMARALAKQGHLVHAFCVCDAPGEYDGVFYHPIASAEAQVASCNYDILISSRWPEFLRMEGRAGLRVLWCHDTLVDPNRFMGGLIQADLVFLLSEYHKKNYKQFVSEIDSFSWITKNGVDLDLIKENLRPKVPGKVIYTSRPERGLHYLLADILPLLISQRPDIKLHFCNYDLQGMQVPDQVSSKISASYELAKQYPNNVVFLGNLDKARLYQEISSSELLLYPSDFPEISCITAIEAQACGTPIVTTKDFALEETVGPDCGILIPGLPISESYIKEFVQRTLGLLENRDELAKLRENCPKWVREQGYSWDAVALSWHYKFTQFFEERWTTRKKDIAKELFRMGDVVPALLLCTGEELEKANELRANFSHPEQTTESVKDSYRVAESRLRTLVDLYNFTEPAPKNVTDVLPSFCSYGIMLNSFFPEANINIVELDEAAVSLHRKTAEHLKRDKVTITQLESEADLASIPDEQDVIILGDVLQYTDDPKAFLYLMSGKLKDDGYFLISTPIGPLAALSKDTKCTKLWNLGWAEYREIFKESPSFKAAACPEGRNELGEMVGHFVVVAQKAKKYHNVDLKKKKFTRPYEDVSFCIITGEEQHHLEGMLRSIEKVADEIIVVDTRPEGSVDRSAEIAEEFGATIRTHKFDNFAAARNESIRDVQGRWIFWIDADERLFGAENIRKYLSNSVYNGYAVKQVHLAVDQPVVGHDIPVRLLRNLPNHKFTGFIHEHCEDISKGPFDNPIAPRLLLPDVEIAHLGYLHESQRRKKCSNRNMALLQRSLKEQPERRLNWVLAIRDYLNILKWESKGLKFVERGGKHHRMLEAVVDTFLEHFPDQKAPYYQLAFPMYQEALQVLGRCGLPYKNSPHPPFEVAIALVGGMGGVQSQHIEPQRIWFPNADLYFKTLQRDAAQMAVQLGVAEPEQFGDLLTKAKETVTYGAPNPVELLAPGVNVFK